MDELKQLGGHLRLSVWGKQRPWKEMVQAFSVPRRPELEQRLLTNSHYYRANYLFVGLVILLWSLLTNWRLLLSTVLLGAAFVYVFYLRQIPIVIGGNVVKAKQKRMALAAAGIILMLLLGCFTSFLWLAVWIVVPVLGHCTFRTPTRVGMYGRSGKASMYSSAGSDAEGEMSGDEEAGAASGAGPLPGTVETRQRKNDEYRARRDRLKQRYPNICMDDEAHGST